MKRSGPGEGVSHPTPDEWKAAVKKTLDELGWSQAELAERIGATAAALSHVLTKAKHSTLRVPIDEIIGRMRLGEKRLPALQEFASTLLDEREALKERLAASERRLSALTAQMFDVQQRLSEERLAYLAAEEDMRRKEDELFSTLQYINQQLVRRTADSSDSSDETLTVEPKAGQAKKPVQ